MLTLINNFLLLDYRWLTSCTLAVYFHFRDKDNFLKRKVIQELESLLIFAFRVITVKGKKREEKPLWEIRGISLKKLVGEEESSLDSLLDIQTPALIQFCEEFETQL